MQAQHSAPDMSFESHADFYRHSAYGAFPQEHRSGGSFGLNMIRVDQEPIDLIDAAVPDLVFARTENDVGSVLFDAGDGATTVVGSAGTFAYFPAHTEVRTRVDVPHALTVLALKHETIAALMLDAGSDVSVFDRLAAKLTSHVVASSIMDRMWQATIQPGSASYLYLDGLTLELLSVLCHEAGLSPFGRDYIEDLRIIRAIDYLEAHIGEPLTVEELASVAALSVSQFARVFKSTTGEAVWAFVQRRRLERAQDLLRHTTIPIAQVAFECGFASQNHMTNLFRRHLGLTPGSLRANS